jgi:hypothetical protein
MGVNSVVVKIVVGETVLNFDTCFGPPPFSITLVGMLTILL